MTEDIRWQQRFANYNKALKKVDTAIAILSDAASEGGTDEDTTEMLREGLVQRFEYTYELAWNVMKDYAGYQGQFEIKGSRDATRMAFKMGLIEDAEGWMDMLESRKLTTHTYNKDTADEIYLKIVNSYYLLLTSFKDKMEALETAGGKGE